MNQYFIKDVTVTNAVFDDITVEPTGKFIAKIDVLNARNITIKRNGCLIKARDVLAIRRNRIKGGFETPAGTIPPNLHIDFPFFKTERSFFDNFDSSVVTTHSQFGR